MVADALSRLNYTQEATGAPTLDWWVAELQDFGDFELLERPYTLVGPEAVP